jgi:hypothetical protein
MTAPKSKKRDIQAEHESRFDQEQQGFLRAFEAGEYVDTGPPSPSELAAHQQAARRSRLSRQRKNKQVTMRLTEADLDAIKAEATKQGMPYQTLIGSVLHKYVTGQLVEKG